METKKITDQIPQQSQNAVKMVRSWSSVKYLVEGVDHLAENIKKQTGSHCDRSKLLNALSEILIDCQQHIETSHIRNHETLKEALVKELKKHK